MIVPFPDQYHSKVGFLPVLQAEQTQCPHLLHGRKAPEGEEAAQRGIGCFGFSLHLEPFPKRAQVISTPLSFRNLQMNNKQEQFKTSQDLELSTSQFFTHGFLKTIISLFFVRLLKKIIALSNADIQSAVFV